MNQCGLLRNSNEVIFDICRADDFLASRTNLTNQSYQSSNSIFPILIYFFSVFVLFVAKADEK